MPPSTQASSSKLKAKPIEGKKKTVKKSIPDAAVDIDSIFSKPAKPKAKTDVGSSSKGKEKAQEGGSSKTKQATDTSSASGTSKKKKAKKVEGDTTASTAVKPDSSRVVEVVDTSIPKVKEVVEPVKEKKRDKKAAEEDEMFADSRGTGPSTLSLLMCCDDR